jgi:hypothetical protein
VAAIPEQVGQGFAGVGMVLVEEKITEQLLYLTCVKASQALLTAACLKPAKVRDL